MQPGTRYCCLSARLPAYLVAYYNRTDSHRCTSQDFTCWAMPQEERSLQVFAATVYYSTPPTAAAAAALSLSLSLSADLHIRDVTSQRNTEAGIYNSLHRPGLIGSNTQYRTQRMHWLLLYTGIRFYSDGILIDRLWTS